jgi:bifunctional polynucleotide phosphatase/kinase
VKRRQQSTITSTYETRATLYWSANNYPGKAVANFFTPASKKEPEKMMWRVVNDSLLIGRYQAATVTQTAKSGAKRRKIAAFDFVRLSTCRAYV